MDSPLIGGGCGDSVIDDGSTDRRGRSRTNMSETIRGIVRAVQAQAERGGHGPASTRDCTLATGRYFKVVDLDDWLSE